jgi:rhodanese-related sulfurtransferase
MSLKSAIGVTAVIVLTSAAGSAIADGNRYNQVRYYHSEISAAQAYDEMKNGEHDRYHARGHRNQPVLIDVRAMEEFAAGHPEDGYNVPYPTVCTGCATQTAEIFYWEVFKITRGDTDRLIMTLCRTGSRSISTANILANPSAFGINGPAFTNVRNIWEGYTGQYKYAYVGGTILLDANGKPIPLDLNNNGAMDADSADVYVERKDANADKDGWRNFQQLPWSTKVDHQHAYLQNPRQYRNLTLTPVQ